MHWMSYLITILFGSFSLILQQAAFVLNASRRFRYTLDLKKEEEKEQKKSMIRAHAQVIRVMFFLSLPIQPSQFFKFFLF